MSETHSQINFNHTGNASFGEFPDGAMQAAIDQRVAEREAATQRFQLIVDGGNLDAYAQEIDAINRYFSDRGLAIDPVRVVSADTLARAYNAAGEHPTGNVESAQGRHVHGRTLVVENNGIQALFGTGYILGIGLHEAAHSVGSNHVITTTREISTAGNNGQSSMRVVVGGIASAGLIKADLRRGTPNEPIGDFWEEAHADLTRVRGLRYLRRSHSMTGNPKVVEIDGACVTVLPSNNTDTPHEGIALPAEFVTLAKTSAEGRNMVGVAPANFAAYALELLDAQIPGLYDDLEAGLHDPIRQTAAIRNINSVRPGLYRQLRDLAYTTHDFMIGLELVLGAVASAPKRS